jgi:diguanylate cyclase (GGDEF)-like protein
MVDVNSGLYIFNADDTSKIHTPVENEDLKNICAKYKGTTATDSTGDYEYVKDGDKYISIYTYIPERGWLVTIDDTKGEVFALKTTMIIYLGIFGAVILGLIIVFNVINRRQAIINEKLVSTIAKNNMTKKSLNTAMFKDVLTGTNNRVSFTMNAEKIKASNDSPCFFAMFNVIQFSEINSRFGSEAGDVILVRTAEVLTEFFPDSEIYRTGSDEFMVVIPTNDGDPTQIEVVDKVNIAFRQMIVPKEIENVGTIYPEYKAVVGKMKGGTAGTAIITALKKKMNASEKASIGTIECIDL